MVHQAAKLRYKKAELFNLIQLFRLLQLTPLFLVLSFYYSACKIKNNQKILLAAELLLISETSLHQTVNKLCYAYKKRLYKKLRLFLDEYLFIKKGVNADQ